MTLTLSILLDKMSYPILLEKVQKSDSGVAGLDRVLMECKHQLGEEYKGVAKFAILYRAFPGGRALVPVAVAASIMPPGWVASTPFVPGRGMRVVPKPSQVEIVKELVSRLAAEHAVMLNLDPGMGKTYLSIMASRACGLKTVVAVMSVDAATQWENEFYDKAEGMEGKIYKLGSVRTKNTCTIEEAEVLIVRAAAIAELEFAPEIWQSFRMLIIDETHAVGTKRVMESFMNFTCVRYVIGCSGTPEKPDGRHHAMACFVGRNPIVARHGRSIDFFLLNLGVTADESNYLRACQNVRGESNEALAEYGILERGISEDSVCYGRIALLALLLVRKYGHKVLVITKFTKQIAGIKYCLEAWGKCSVTTYIGKSKADREYDGFADVLVGTAQMTMTMFDQATSGRPFDRRFTAAIMCQSLAQDGNLWQAIGRVMRAPEDVSPIFVWIQYPLKAYARHTREMREFVEGRGLVVKDGAELLPRAMKDGPVQTTRGSFVRGPRNGAQCKAHIR
jgi:hypothetical protein